MVSFVEAQQARFRLELQLADSGVVHHATVCIGDSMSEMGEAHGEAQPMPPALYMYVENLEETYERALNAGAEARAETRRRA